MSLVNMVRLHIGARFAVSDQHMTVSTVHH